MSIGSIYKRHETEFKVEVHWEIENFSRLLKSTCTSRSPSFTWSSCSWELQMPCNFPKEIGLFLCDPKSGKTLPVVFKFGICLADGDTEMRCSLIKNFTSSALCFGTYEFILGSELVDRKNELLPEGNLAVSCSIAHLDTLTKPQNVKYENLDALSSSFKTLYGSTYSSDMTIVVDNQRYPVHKTILGARSDVFAAMFQHDMEEVKSGVIKIADCESTSLEDFLLYLYTGKVENFSSSNVCTLYRFADKYNVQDLKDLCIKYMKRNIATTNLFDILILANQFNETGLISASQRFFNRNSLDIIKRDDWEEFLKQNFPIANQLLINVLEKAKIENM